MRVIHPTMHLVGQQYDCAPAAYLDKVATFGLTTRLRNKDRMTRPVGTIVGAFQARTGQWYAVGEWPRHTGAIVWPVCEQ